MKRFLAAAGFVASLAATVAFVVMTSNRAFAQDAIGRYANSMATADAPMLPASESDPDRWLPVVKATISISKRSRPTAATRAAQDQSPYPPYPVPAMPSLPQWTKCSSSWSQTLTSDPDTGQVTWHFATTLDLEEIGDLATSVRWYADIRDKHREVVRNYQWVECAGFRVRDWRLNSGGKSPVDYYGAQGLDSPLGSCHSSTPTALHFEAACGEKDEAHGCAAARVPSTKLALGGVLEDDGKIHGLVRWSGDGLFYEGTIADVACANGCAVEFDHPCSIPSPISQPFIYRGPMQTNGKATAVYTWWYGENPRDPGPWAAGFVAARP